MPKCTIEVSNWSTKPLPAAAFTVSLPADCQKIGVLKIAAEAETDH